MDLTQPPYDYVFVNEVGHITAKRDDKPGLAFTLATVEVFTPGKTEAATAFMTHACNSYDELLAALNAVMQHPHIRAYLPYDPKDATFLAAMRAIRTAGG